MNTIALVGNPNCGKTTLFNAITGSNQHVGNWPGVTVEKKVGEFKYKNKIYNVVDLPGTYSLGAYSDDEVVARDYILKGNPDVVINVIDATNIERNLYLTTQLLEMDAKVVIALNMVDEAKLRKIDIDLQNLSRNLGVPVISTIASKKIGLKELIEKAIDYIDEKTPTYKKLSYGENIDREIDIIRQLLDNSKTDYPTNWIAIKLLEGDQDVIQQIDGEKVITERLQSLGDKAIDYELEIVDRRYDFINNVVRKSVVKPVENIVTLTDKIDKIITNKYLGLPIFGIIMFIVFELTFKIGKDLLGNTVETWVQALGAFISKELILINAPKWLASFISDGIFGGIGAVVAFIPLITVLYFFLGILEDTGYMARAAYIMDSIMRTLGLQGKTFISMIIGFGCNVPGIMATRTLESKKDKMIAILINPFMSCGARIPIYLLFISAFFPKHGGIILFSIYALGIIVALIMGKIFSKVLFKGESSHFIMELPPYRLPSLSSVIRNMWEQVVHFIERAGTVIFTVVAILWVLSIFPLGVEPYSQGSLLGKVGTLIAPIFKPAGFGNWQASVSLAAGIAAKEAVVAVLGMVYAGATEGSELITAIQNAFTPLTAVSFMVMVLLYTPCAATIATVKQETNSYKWAIFIAVYTFAIAWIAAVLVFQIGSLLGF